MICPLGRGYYPNVDVQVGCDAGGCSSGDEVAVVIVIVVGILDRLPGGVSGGE